MASIFNQNAFDLWIQESLNREFSEAAELTIQRALKDYEAQIRRALGTKMATIMTEQYSMERIGRDLRITVKVGGDD